jgi:hypothetical protein
MLLAAPAVASATPQWRMNGALVGETKQHAVQFGTLTLNQVTFGEWKCSVLAGMPVWNEGGNGLASVESWVPYDCSSTSCPSGANVTAETPVKLEEKTNAKGETEYTAIRGEKTTPWPAQTAGPEAGVPRLAIHKIRLTLECPGEAFQPKFSGVLEPRLVNGIGNGMSPSHVLFEGKGGKTGSLSADFCSLGCEGSGLYVSGQLTTLGTRGQELITAE